MYGLDRKEITTAEMAGYALSGQKYSDKRVALNRLWSGNPNCDYIIMFRDKLCFGAYLRQFGFPTPVNDYMVRDGKITDLKTMQEIPMERVRDIDFDHFVKSATGGSGRGIFSLRSMEAGLSLDGKPIEVAELVAMIAKGFYIIQRRVEQHPDIAKINPTSINSLRILTIQTENGVKPMAASMRFGGGKSVVDNISVGGMCVGVDMQSGRLKGPGCYKAAKATPTHPYSGVKFDGVDIPYYAEALDMVTRLHTQVFYGMHSVGWDIALTPEGPVVVEGNDNWNPDVLQMPNGGVKYLFDEYFDPILKKNRKRIR